LSFSQDKPKQDSAHLRPKGVESSASRCTKPQFLRPKNVQALIFAALFHHDLPLAQRAGTTVPLLPKAQIKI
jgi:hypothetical protein